LPVFAAEEWAEKIRSQSQTIYSEVPKGTLIMDATCCPADISYPQDIRLLNEALEKLKHIADAYLRPKHCRGRIWGWQAQLWA